MYAACVCVCICCTHVAGGVTVVQYVSENDESLSPIRDLNTHVCAYKAAYSEPF